MKSLFLSILTVMCVVSVKPAFAQSIEPSNPDSAVKFANVILEELDRAQQDLVGRHDPERVVCYFFGRLTSLYEVKSEQDATVSVLQFDGNGHDLPPSVRTVPVPSFTNPNIDSITVCRPNQIPANNDRKSAITALKTEIKRLTGN